MEPIACQNQNEKMHLHEKKDPTNNVHHNCNSNYVRRALTGFPAQGLPGQLAVLTVGGTVTAIVFLLAALPLGLWEELRAVLRQAKTGKNRGK